MDEGIVKKIKALLAKARGTENEIEAALFAEGAAKLLQKHNLEEHDLGSDEAVAPMIQSMVKSVDTNPWRMSIYGALAELYFSRIYVDSYIEDTKLRRGVVIVGRPHNIEIVKSMADYLIKTTLRLAKQHYSLRRDVLRFEKGCGLRLGERIREMARAAQAPAPQVTYQPGQTTLPALYKTELELAQGIVDDICKGNKVRGGHKGGGNAAAHGRQAANSVSLGQQITGAGSRHLLT